MLSICRALQLVKAPSFTQSQQLPPQYLQTGAYHLPSKQPHVVRGKAPILEMSGLRLSAIRWHIYVHTAKSNREGQP